MAARVVHHEFRAPFGLTALYTHPLEEILSTLATMSGPLLFGKHILPLWIWSSLRLIEAIDSHSGL
jgi:sterol desaturase/sphingolipid hydroxylase (fatty acid hydroxylase superfamily)